MPPVTKTRPEHCFEPAAGVSAEACVGGPAQSILRKCTELLAGVALMALSATATASCYGNAAADLDVGTLSFDASLPVGSVLKQVSLMETNRRGSYYCNAGRYVRAHRGGSNIARPPDIYSSNIPGIGYRIGQSGSGWYPGQGAVTPWPADNVNYATQGAWFTMTIQLIKTGPITEGGVLSGVAGVRYVVGSSPYITMHWGRAVVNPELPTCTFIVNNGRDVELGRHYAGMFTGVGSTSPAVPFNITSGGCNADTTRVHMSWRGTADVNDPDTFRITNGALRGVGVWIEQVSDGATMAPNGARQSFNPPAIGQNYEYRARFKQTLPTITEGTGSTAVTINITYN